MFTSLFGLAALLSLMAFASSRGGKAARGGKRSGGGGARVDDDGFELPPGPDASDMEGDGGEEDTGPSRGEAARDDDERPRTRSGKEKKEDEEEEKPDDDSYEDGDDDDDLEDEEEDDASGHAADSDDPSDLNDQQYELWQRCQALKIDGKRAAAMTRGVPEKLRYNALGKILDEMEAVVANATEPYSGNFARPRGGQGGGQNENQQGGGAPAPAQAAGGGAATTKSRKLELKLKAGVFDPELEATLNSITEHYGKQIDEVEASYTTERQQNAVLKNIVVNLQNRAVENMLDSFVDHVGISYAGLFGKGPTSELPRNSAAYRARMELVEQAGVIDDTLRKAGKGQLSDRQLLFRALAGAFPGQHRIAERRRLKSERGKHQRGARGLQPRHTREPEKHGEEEAVGFIKDFMADLH